MTDSEFISKEEVETAIKMNTEMSTKPNSETDSAPGETRRLEGALTILWRTFHEVLVSLTCPTYLAILRSR